MALKDTIFYYLKLQMGFMTGDQVDFLMSQKNGANYVVLYQMLILKTINSKGTLATQIGEMIIPFDEEKIQRECRYFDIDTIRVALELYKKLGLVYRQENGLLAITNFEDFVGSHTYWAERKRIQRQEDKECSGQELENVQRTTRSNILISSNTNNINTKDKDKDKDITIIFEEWNKLGIIFHKELNDDIKKAITKALKVLSLETIIECFKRYNTILNDKSYYFDYKWSLKDFLNRKNGIVDFTDEGSKWNDYQKHISRNTQNQEPTSEKITRTTTYLGDGVCKIN